MYSPKIDTDLIPILYRLAKARGMPMTRLVNACLHAMLDTPAVRLELAAAQTKGDVPCGVRGEAPTARVTATRHARGGGREGRCVPTRPHDRSPIQGTDGMRGGQP